MEAAGQDPHGEVNFVLRYQLRSVLDAGCGTGRVAIELANRGIEAVGVDLDPAMLATARAKAPQLRFELADLAALDLRRSFDVVVMAGNVMIFVEPGTEGQVLQRAAVHVRPAGLLICGFQLGRGLALEAFDALAADAGLDLEERFSSWDGAPFAPSSSLPVGVAGPDYAVSVHRRRPNDS